jgi:hypothetical protein
VVQLKPEGGRRREEQVTKGGGSNADMALSLSREGGGEEIRNGII